jgi:hypothetical protein
VGIRVQKSDGFWSKTIKKRRKSTFFMDEPQGSNQHSPPGYGQKDYFVITLILMPFGIKTAQIGSISTHSIAIAINHQFCSYVAVEIDDYS